MNVLRIIIGWAAGAIGVVMIVPIVVLVAPLSLIRELSGKLAQWLEPRYTPWSKLVEFDPVMGWRTRGGFSGYHLADDGVYRTTTDVEGWRGRTALNESRVVVFGDSYVFGHAIDDEGFFADLNPKLAVKAIGVSGYNMVQEFMWIRKLAPRMKGKLVVWFVYLGNDLTDSLSVSVDGYTVPFVREGREEGEWEIVTNHLKASLWPSGPGYHIRTFYERVAKIFVPGPFADRVFSAAGHLIREGDQIVRSVGGRLVIVSVPSKNMLLKEDMHQLLVKLPRNAAFDVDYPDRQLGGICRKLGVQFVAGKDHLTGDHYHHYESHWNRSGHRKMAELLGTLHTECDAAVEAEEALVEREG